jgi:hypothetical protein
MTSRRTELEVIVLDIKGTHCSNPECPMYIAKNPVSDRWYCVNCGLEILVSRVRSGDIKGDL